MIRIQIGKLILRKRMRWNGREAAWKNNQRVRTTKVIKGRTLAWNTKVKISPAAWRMDLARSVT